MTSKIIGRVPEQEELLEIFQSKKAELTVVYGRRRIGKTYLIQEFFANKDCLFFYVTGIQKGTRKEHLEEFAKALGQTFYSNAILAPATSWLKAFEELTKAIANFPNKKIILFFDELPWMATPRSRLLQAIDYYWNRFWSKNPNIKFIICGSSAAWIIKNIINNKGGLHNRATHQILLRPFNLAETKAFLEYRNIKLKNWQILQIYMVLGGVPHYLEKLKKNLSIGQNIDRLCFQEKGFLFNEFDNLFKSLFEDAKAYIELIKIIAKSREGVAAAWIEKQSKISSKGGTLTERLADLELAGFIKSFLPLNHNRKGIYYRVIDEYCYFYLQWIAKEKSTLLTQELDNQYWATKMQTPQYFIWMGYAFESVCYKHISQIRQALKIPLGSRAGSWRYAPQKKSVQSGAQIDLLFERHDAAVTLCEIKCTHEPYVLDKQTFQLLQQKMDIYQKITRTSRQIFMALISANGISNNFYAEELLVGIATLEDLMK